MRRLSEDPQLRENVEFSDPFRTCDGDCSLREGFVGGMMIRGLSRLGHDGRPWLKVAETCKEEGDQTPALEGSCSLDLAATVLARDCEFDACYNFKDGDKQVSGRVCGKVEIVRIDLVIGHPTELDGAAELKVFEAKEFTGLTFSKMDAGMVHQKFIAEATAQVVRCCIDKLVSLRVAPLLVDVLRANAYPKFVDA